MLAEACISGSRCGAVCHCATEAVAASRAELHLWHASFQRASKGGSKVDFCNAFGWHALPADDRVWASEPFVKQWLAVAQSGCRGDGDSLPVASGPLEATSELVVAAARLMPREYSLIAVTGSGTEAILSFYDVANAFLSAETGEAVVDAQLLFFRGCYVGGAHGLQRANGIDVIADQAFAPCGVPDDCLVDAPPYCRSALAEFEALLSTHAERSTHASGTAGTATLAAALTEVEDACLRSIDERVERMRAAGGRVGGMVVELVTSHGVEALRPAFVARLRALLREKRLLLLEDAVMVGLRCGAPFLGCASSALQPDFVAIGKAWGFSGVLAHAASALSVRWRRGLPHLNGFLTMRMSAADLLRAVTVLDAVHGRRLVQNARRSGARLRGCLQAQGLHCWGIGLLLGYEDATSSEVGQTSRGRTSRGQLLNASAAFSRLLPPLTLGEQPADWAYVSTLVVGDAEAATRVAERVLWLQLEAADSTAEREAGAEADYHTDYRPRVEAALQAGRLAPYSAILSPELRERQPKGFPPPPPEVRLERVSLLWADVLGM